MNIAAVLEISLIDETRVRLLFQNEEEALKEYDRIQTARKCSMEKGNEHRFDEVRLKLSPTCKIVFDANIVSQQLKLVIVQADAIVSVTCAVYEKAISLTTIEN